MSRPVDDGDPRREAGEDRDRTAGGDPVCWLDRVCPECGRFVEDEPPTRCPVCGAALLRP